MKREDIIRMAQKAYGDWYPNAVPPELERFAALVAAAEREVCAEYAAALAEAGWSAGSIADAIRERGKT